MKTLTTMVNRATEAVTAGQSLLVLAEGGYWLSQLPGGLDANGVKGMLGAAVKDVTAIEQGFESVSKGFERVGGLRDGSGGDALPGALVGMSQKAKDDFDKTISTFLGKFPEASAFKQAFHAYVDCCSATNQKRLELTTELNNLAKLIQERAQAEQQEQVLRQNGVSDNLTGRYYNDVKKRVYHMFEGMRHSVLYILVQQHKALNYLLLKDEPFQIVDLGADLPAMVADALVSSQERLLSALDEQGGRLQYEDMATPPAKPVRISLANHPFPRATPPAPQVAAAVTPAVQATRPGLTVQRVGATGVTAVQAPAGLQAIGPIRRPSRCMAFTIRPNDPAFLGLHGVKVAHVKVKIPGIEASSANAVVCMSLHHGGDSRFALKDGKTIAFSRTPVTVNLRLDPNSGGEDSSDTTNNLRGSPALTELNGRPCYDGVSPFATWVLEFSADENQPGVDFSGVTEMELYFQCFAQT